MAARPVCVFTRCCPREPSRTLAFSPACSQRHRNVGALHCELAAVGTHNVCCDYTELAAVGAGDGFFVSA